MKVCDRCKPEFVPASESVHFEREGTTIDLCEQCKKAMLEVLQAQKPKRGRPKKG